MPPRYDILARIADLPSDMPKQDRDYLLSLWQSGSSATADDLAHGRQALVDEVLRRLDRYGSVSLGETILTGRYALFLTDADLTGLLDECLRAILAAGASPVLSLRGPVETSGQWGFATDEIRTGVLSDWERLGREVIRGDYLFALPRMIGAGGSGKPARPSWIDGIAACVRTASASPKAWIAERPLVAVWDDLPLDTLRQAGVFRFGLDGPALEAFVRACVEAVLASGARLLEPTWQEDPAFREMEVPGVSTPDLAVRLALDERYIDNGILLAFRPGDPFRPGGGDPGPPPAPERGRRPGSETSVVTLAEFDDLVLSLSRMAFPGEGLSVYPGVCFHMPDGVIVGYRLSDTFLRILEVLDAPPGTPLPLPIVIQADEHPSDPVRIQPMNPPTFA